VSILHIVVLTAILLVFICADDLLDRAAWTRGLRRDNRALRRLDRSLDNADPVPVPVPRAETALGPTIEQIAADLRRLDRQRRGGIATESTAWLAAVLRAYDDRLKMASRCLGVAEHLEMLDGVDREIERVRVEGRLQSAGLMLRSVAHRPPDRLP
jgi:hypothetical protein